jgi:hypothetical protein
MSYANAYVTGASAIATISILLLAANNSEAYRWMCVAYVAYLLMGAVDRAVISVLGRTRASKISFEQWFCLVAIGIVLIGLSMPAVTTR